MRFIMKQDMDGTWYFAFVPIDVDEISEDLRTQVGLRGATRLGLEIATGYVWDLDKDQPLGHNQRSRDLAASFRESEDMEWWENTCDIAAPWMEDVRKRRGLE